MRTHCQCEHLVGEGCMPYTNLTCAPPYTCSCAPAAPRPCLAGILGARCSPPGLCACAPPAPSPTCRRRKAIRQRECCHAQTTDMHAGMLTSTLAWALRRAIGPHRVVTTEGTISARLASCKCRWIEQYVGIHKPPHCDLSRPTSATVVARAWGFGCSIIVAGIRVPQPLLRCASMA